MAAVTHVEDVGVEMMNRVILSNMSDTCPLCIEVVQQFVVTIVVALEHGFDEDGDWIQRELDGDVKENRRKRRLVNMMPGFKDAKGRAEWEAGHLRSEKRIYSEFKLMDSKTRHAVLYAFGARFGKDKATIDGLLASEAVELGYEPQSAPSRGEMSAAGSSRVA
ncbi:hypothetical protein BGZ61DRAFT_535375 [Ilyonectria robusta]|uniref:uncharacterized protein n=1 Tax=Ilyonectria robusta TaxID=1079257 RepID=UPI001E8EC2CD|nr:uncharacterized protein BGZ61DRAFT_535375 [Ilyonectria robusta]KAH8680303.1 hypothetical protein BGZ61DRAFT_535375 [Ilyonectria robusta]